MNNEGSNIVTRVIENDISQDSIPLLYNSYDEISRARRSPRSGKYPKLTSSYPEIMQGNKMNVKQSKVTKISSKLSKPPSSKPPVFLKCKVKVSVEKNSDNESEDESKSKSMEYPEAAPLSDLDVQMNDCNFEMTRQYPSSIKNKCLMTGPVQPGQSLNQYCNFEEKRIVRVAPHIRRKDIICDTVDAWSADNDAQIDQDRSNYKPLIFGGTYPIDMPLHRNPVARAIQIRKYIDAGKTMSKTFDIDAPTNDSI